jgi:HSP90 family molecular chaperone
VVFRYVWESKADGAFAVSEDTWNEPIGRGTEIRLHLREEAGEYLEESKLKVRIFYLFDHNINLVAFVVC